MTLTITKTRTETETLDIRVSSRDGGELTIGSPGMRTWRDPTPDELPLIARAVLEGMTGEQLEQLRVWTDRLREQVEELTRERDVAIKITFEFEDDELADEFWGYWLDGGGEYGYLDAVMNGSGESVSTDWSNDPERVYTVCLGDAEDESPDSEDEP